MSSATRPARGARRSTREPSATGSTSRRSISVDPVAAALAEEGGGDDDDDDDEPDPDDSTGSNSRRRNRPQINRRVPHQSFAYGAPSDGKQRQSIGSRDPAASTSMTPSPHKAAVELNAHAEPDESQPQPQPLPAQPAANSAASRYAALKAKKQAAATVRSTTTMETSDDEVDAHGKSRKSSVPPPPRSSTSTNRSGQESQLNSFFLRAPASNASQSISPGPDDHRATSSQQRLVMPSSLLRGAQKQPHEHIPPMLLSPRRRGAAMAANPFNDSSEAGDSVSRSYDYASEEAFVQRNGSANNTARDTTPPTRPPGWFEKISPWRNRVSTGQLPVNGTQTNHDGDDDDDDDEADDANTSTRTARRRPRTSQGDRDQTYRPPKDFELDDDDEESSDGGRKSRRKPARRSAGDHSARGGRDDNKIWKATKRRKGRRSGANGGNAEEDSSEGDEEDEVEADALLNGDVDEGAFVDGLQTSEEPPRRKASRKRKSPSSPSASSGFGKPLGLGALVLLAAYLCFSGSGSLEASVDSNQPSGLLSSLPIVGKLVSSRKQRPVFKAPNVPPSDLEALVDRLLSLESSVGSLSSASSSLLASRDSMAKQIASLEMSDQEFARVLSKLEGRDATDRDLLGSRVKALEEVGKRLRQQMDQLEIQQQRGESHTEKGLKEQRKVLDDQLKALQRDVKKNEEEIARVLTSAVAAERVALEAKEALRPLLEMNLPAQLPVKIDRRSGKPVIEGWFYEALKGMLGGAAADSAPPTVSHFDWDTFRSVNDASLRALIAEQAAGVFDAQRTQHAVLSRSDFLALLSRELDSMKGVLEKQFNDNAQGIQNDILAKVRSQQAMYEESGSWKGGSGRDVSRGKRVGGSGSSSLPLVEEVSLSQVQTKDGSDATGAVLTLIDAALEAYSADKLNRADFAAYSAGGRVIPSMTSPTFEYSLGGSASSGGLLSWVLPWKGVTSAEKFRGRSPAHALHHDNQPGMCWPFRGSYGQLGIQLARPVIVSDITIDHAPYSLLFGDKGGGGIDSAPREITVSGYIERVEDRERLREWQATQQDDDEMADILPNPPPNHIHLASFTYEGPSPHTRPTQTFSVSPEARALRIPVMLLQVRVHSNHGNERFTCLYRVRVHGEEVRW